MISVFWQNPVHTLHNITGVLTDLPQELNSIRPVCAFQDRVKQFDEILLERDLNARLDRYAGDEDITDVWIWYEDLGEGRYLIYIGYA